MKGSDWDGQPIDCKPALLPLINTLQQKQKELGYSARYLSRTFVGSDNWLHESTKNMHNPTVARVARWASIMEAEEFGLFTQIGGHHHETPIYDIDEKPPWKHLQNGRLIPDLREPLRPFADLMVRYRKERFGTCEEFAAGSTVSRSAISELEGGSGIRNPTLGRLRAWAQRVGAERFGPYVIIDGEYTEADLLGEARE